MLGAPTPWLVAASPSVNAVPTVAGSTANTYPLTPLTAPADAVHSRRATPPPFDASSTVPATAWLAACAGVPPITIDARTTATIDSRATHSLTDMHAPPPTSNEWRRGVVQVASAEP